MENKILAILDEIQPGYDFAGEDDFIAEGYLDSFDVVTLVTELEEAFGVSISALDIVPENFSSLQSIASLLQRSKKT